MSRRSEGKCALPACPGGCCDLDGGDAFPFPGSDGDFDEHIGGPSRGMKLRDYFIAHAPAKPQPWFLPTMLADCPLVPSVGGIADADLRRRVNDYFDVDGSGDFPDDVLRWVHTHQEAAKAQEAWQAEFRKQTFVQWPIAWADEILAAKEAL